MTVRAMWKGVVIFNDVRLPVKLFAAVEDRSVRFRLLHEDDGVPLRQRMVNPVRGVPVEQPETRRGFEVEPDRFVVLTPEELESMAPEASREIHITRFVDPSEINHQWYDRPYYLGPDGNDRSYYSFAHALERQEKEGVARWVMRGKRYRGSLRARDGHLLLITLRSASEVIPSSELDAPEGRSLEERERELARRFIEALEDDFEPSEYRDQYRERLASLIEIKRRGQTIEVPKLEEKEAPEELEELLRASLEAVS